MLRGRRCAECRRLWLEEANTCPYCGSPGGESVQLSGKGRLVSWTTIRVPPARYAAEAPYVVGLVVLDEGLRLTARLAADPETLTSGLGVALASQDPARGPVFCLA
jgi:uncharacterized OB-fold protein